MLVCLHFQLLFVRWCVMCRKRSGVLYPPGFLSKERALRLFCVCTFNFFVLSYKNQRLFLYYVVHGQEMIRVTKKNYCYVRSPLLLFMFPKTKRVEKKQCVNVCCR